LDQNQDEKAIKLTKKQGQYLTYIYYYTKINGRSPAQSDMQFYFKVSPPSVHQMVLKLEKEGLIERTPRVARSVKVLLDPKLLSKLE